MTRTSGPFRGLLGAMLFVTAVQMNVRLEQVHQQSPLRHTLYLPSGKYLRYASLGFNHLLADLLYVWSIQYYSDVRSERWAYLARLYDTITDLDPRYTTSYAVGALILSMEAGQPDAAMALLDKGIEKNPGTYSLAWEAAFWARTARNPDRMRAYLEVAMSRPDAPPFVTRWHAITVDRLGTTAEAMALWQGIRRDAKSDYDRSVAERWVHDLSLELLLTQTRQRIAAFSDRERRWPHSLEELGDTGSGSSAAVDAEGHPLLYDRHSGKVEPSCGFLLKNRLKATYRGN